MASVTIQKHTTQAACCGQVGHIYRTREQYGNSNIQPDLIKKNLYFGTSEKALDCISKTIADIDREHPPKRVRSDRKTVASLCIPAPRAGLSEKETVSFFARAYTKLQAVTDMRIVAAAVHKDEVHAYTDPDSRAEVQSRLHMHVLVVPDLPGKGCCMKQWLTRSRYRDINRLMDEACRDSLGYDYQDGSRAKSRGDVERMKIKSLQAQAEQEQARLQQLQEQQVQLTADLRAMGLQKRCGSVQSSEVIQEIVQCTKPTIRPDRLSVPQKGFSELVSMAQEADQLKTVADQLSREAEQLKHQADQADERAARKYRQQSLDASIKQAAQARKLARYERLEAAFPDVFKQMDTRLRSQDIQHSQEH